MIVCSGPGKTAKDESLARDEDGGSISRLREALYKTAQGCQLRTTPATATSIFPVRGRSYAQNRRASKGSAGASAMIKQQEEPRDTVSYHQQTGIDDFDIRRGCGDVRSRCR